MEEDKDNIKELIEILRNTKHNDDNWLNTEEVPGPYKLEGGELTEMSQKKAYEMILRSRKRQPGNRQTTERMEGTRVELTQKTENPITIAEIWTNNKSTVISPKISDFLWKLCHNRHKVEEWFKRITGWEDKSECKCGKLETMNHILMECPLNQGKAI